MKCKRVEKWLSDDLDGELSGRKKNQINDHLASCPSCRKYREALGLINIESKKLDWPELAPEYWQDFSSRLEANVSAVGRVEKEYKALWKHKWVWAAAVLFIGAALGLYFLLLQSSSQQATYFFSTEESLMLVYSEIGEDPELETVLNSMILASIGEIFEDSEFFFPPSDYNTLLFREDVTEEEMKFIESELRKAKITS